MPTAFDNQFNRRILPGFELLLASFDLDAFDAHRSCIYGIRSDLTLAYFNAYWSHFALDNKAPEWIVEPQELLGTSILDYCQGPLQSYYETLYRQILHDHRRRTRDYECSSPEVLRFFHMDIRPLPSEDVETQGLLIINSHSTPVQPARRKNPTAPLSPEQYIDEHGYMISCSNCRRFQRRHDSEAWDWIPDYINDPPAPVSHGICSICLDYYYPAPSDDDE